MCPPIDHLQSSCEEMKKFEDALTKETKMNREIRPPSTNLQSNPLKHSVKLTPMTSFGTLLFFHLLGSN